MLRAVLFDLDDTLMPDESAADEAILAVAQHAEAIHRIPPENLRRSVRSIARRLWNSHPVVAPHDARRCAPGIPSGIRNPDGGFRGSPEFRASDVRFDVSSWSALSAEFAGDDEQMTTLRAWAPEYRREVWTLALAENGVADPMLPDQLAALYPAERVARYRPFADAVPCLQALCSRFSLGLVTNGPCDLQCDKIDRSGLKPYFPVRIISREVGVMKPDPRIFTIALEQLGVSAAETAMVGDSLKYDIAGANAAGITAVWLNRTAVEPTGAGRPDITITSLFELPRALGLEGSRT